MGFHSLQIAIVGAGPVGTSLAKRLVSAGHSVSISNSRGPASLREQEASTGATALDMPTALTKADIVFLGVPLSAIPLLRPTFEASLKPDAIIVDSGNYYPSRDGHIKAIDDGNADSVWVSETLSRPVVKAFNNIIAVHILTSAKPKGFAGRVTLTVSGDDDKAKATVMDLVDQVGFDPYNAGSLADSWRQQPGTPAYCTEPTRKQLVRLLASANRAKAVKMRDGSREIFEKLPPDFSTDVLLRVARLSAGLDILKLQTWFAALVFLWAVVKIKVRGHV